MADDIIAGYEMDLLPDEHRIVIKLPFGWRVEVETGGLTILLRGGAAEDGKWPSLDATSSPDARIELFAAVGDLGYHSPDTGDSVTAIVLPREEEDEK